jgi:hypothetical protein
MSEQEKTELISHEAIERFRREEEQNAALRALFCRSIAYIGGALGLGISWFYCAATYGFLWGFGFGWVPGAIVGIIAWWVCYGLAWLFSYLWPFLVLYVIIFTKVPHQLSNWIAAVF